MWLYLNVWSLSMDNIAQVTIDASNYNLFVDTEIGPIKIQHIHKTFPFKKYLVLFDSGREIECADRHCFILKGDIERLTEDLVEGDVVVSDEGEDIVIEVFNTGETEEMYDLTLESHHKYFTNGILSHNSNVMANIIARQVLAGKTICLASLEMSQDMFAQRFDGIYSCLDINRMYFNQSLQRDLMNRLRVVKGKEGRGELLIKSFPTGKATVNDFKIWVRELKMRGKEPDAFYFDYLNLMSPIEKNKENTYSSVKSVAEETRAMGFEFNIPMISVSQLNRSGTFMSFADVDFNSIAESIGVPATADFMMIMGSNDDDAVYKQEVHYKIVKNRLGGRVGEMSKFYYDARSLKMYDETELQLWMDDVEVSKDERPLAQRDTEESAPRGRRRREE